MKLSALLVTLSSIAAFAQEAAEAAEQQPNSMMSFLPIVLLFVVMWLFFIRPQSKERKKMEEMRKALKKGDKSTTFIDFDKSAIVRVMNAEEKTEEKK